MKLHYYFLVQSLKKILLICIECLGKKTFVIFSVSELDQSHFSCSILYNVWELFIYNRGCMFSFFP